MQNVTRVCVQVQPLRICPCPAGSLCAQKEIVEGFHRKGAGPQSGGARTVEADAPLREVPIVRRICTFCGRARITPGAGEILAPCR